MQGMMSLMKPTDITLFLISAHIHEKQSLLALHTMDNLPTGNEKGLRWC